MSAAGPVEWLEEGKEKHTRISQYSEIPFKNPFASKTFVVMRHKKVEVWASLSSTGRMKAV